MGDTRKYATFGYYKLSLNFPLRCVWKINPSRIHLKNSIFFAFIRTFFHFGELQFIRSIHVNLLLKCICIAFLSAAPGRHPKLSRDVSNALCNAGHRDGTTGIERVVRFVVVTASFACLSQYVRCLLVQIFVLLPDSFHISFTRMPHHRFRACVVLKNFYSH